MNWVDFVIIAILLVFIIIGCVRGFMFSILSLFGGTVNFTLSIIICKPMSMFLNSVFGLESALASSFTSKLSNMSSEFDVVLSSFSSQSELSSHVTNTINNSSLSGFTKGLLGNTVHITTENVAGSDVTLNKVISYSFATFLSLVISFIIVFALIYLILWILSRLSKRAKQVSGVRVTDRILGFVFGAIKGCLVVIMIFGILSFFNENGLLHGLFEQIKESSIGNWAYTNIDGFVHKYIDIKEILKGIIDKV